MTRHRWMLLLATLICRMGVWVVWSYPNGAPESSCVDMTPKHGGQPQSSSSNIYRIQLSANEVAAGNKLTVSLVKSKGSDPPFKGFLIKAVSLSNSDGQPLGQMTSIDGTTTKHVSCSGITRSGITHTDRSPKSEISFEWTAPDHEENVMFLASAVADYSTYWVKFQSAPVRVIGGPSFPQSNMTGVFSSAPVNTPFVPQATRNPPITRNPSIDFDYSVCGESKSCFEFPINCIADKSCRMIVSYKADGDRLHLQLVAFTPGYAAFGLSNDQIMGDDSVIECMITGHANASVNSATNNFIAKSEPSYFTLEKSSYRDGILRCEISRPTRSTVVPLSSEASSVTTDLNAANYYLMLAMGDLNAAASDITFHGSNNMLVSNVAVDLMSSEYLIVGGNNKAALEVVIHGSLMVVAWIGTVSIAIFMARYYKDMWPEAMWCNVKIWFIFHRALNMFTVLLTMAAFILIFVYKKGFSSIWRDNPHPILGCITMGLAIAQPIGAMFRCAPGTAKRPIFNWLHYIVGNATCIVAVVTMFFAVNLSSAHLPKSFWWILIAYIAFYVIVFLVMECLGFMNHRKAEHDIIPMRDYNGHDGSLSSSMHHPDKYGANKFKHVMLFLFIFGVMGFTAALVAVICT